MNGRLNGKPVYLYMGLLFCVTCWGSNFIFGAILVQYFKPMEIAFLRLIFIILFLLLWFYKPIIRAGSVKVMFVPLVFIGFIGVTLNHWSFYASLTKASPVTAALILATAPICTSLINSLVFKERKNALFWMWSILGFAGVFLVIVKKGSIVFGMGEGCILLTMLTFSVYMVLVERYAKHLSSILLTFYSTLVGLILMMAFLPFYDVTFLRVVPFSIWILLFFTAIIMHGICPLIWNHCISNVGSTNTSLLLNVEPFVAMVVGYIVLKESVSGMQLVGGLLILLSVTMAMYSNRGTLTNIDGKDIKKEVAERLV
ncbi:DMT family transporter [Rossellomorea vietnamensis]|uniref:DMT family transporter n=1 Tax=Rossellomorea vietnamensis TaxID=218284 RepID=A0ACD4CD14_9BACI|nr:DMT family transporter [Rossellomorea vietnamensis]UXH46291.1 DMT family transporter [Rossellomorea vietnamensis]